MKELIIDAKTENLNAVLDFINAELEAYGCGMKTMTQISIAAEEIFVNIAHYAYDTGIGKAAVRVYINDGITIEFEDNGKPYNPLENADPDITAKLGEREVGGLGIFMVKNIMDAVEYKRDGGKNILTVRKNFKTSI